jgi:hypothetical protein
MPVKFHLVDAAAVMRQETQHVNAKEMALHLSVAQIMTSLAWVEHHSEKLRAMAAKNICSTFSKVDGRERHIAEVPILSRNSSRKCNETASEFILAHLSDRVLAIITVVGLTAASFGGVAAYITRPLLDYTAPAEQPITLRAEEQISRAVKADRHVGSPDRQDSIIDAPEVGMAEPAPAALLVSIPLPRRRPNGLLNNAQITRPRLAGGDRPPAEVRELDSFAAVENAATGSIAPAARMLDAPAPFRRVQKHVYLLLGGLQGKDGWVTSAGMYRLRSSLAELPDVTVTTYDWPSYKKVAADIALLPKDDIVVVIGYSGGGAKATWLANLPSKPRIDLMVLYDPSPPWGMQVIGPNVKRALCYCNVTPVFFGLGGGVLRGRDTQVETVKIYEQHMLVQVDQTLHQRTIKEVKKTTTFSGPADLPLAAGSQIRG